LVTNDMGLAERVDAIAFPGLTANFDVANTAALAMTLLDWREVGAAYAQAMISAAQMLAAELDLAGVPVAGAAPFTESHAFALDAGHDGGHRMAQHLRRANLLTSAIGLPHGSGDGVRVGTNEMVRWGMTGTHAAELAGLIARAWSSAEPEAVAAEVSSFRQRFDTLHHVR
jgi:glycine hydroxymethyltransferase